MRRSLACRSAFFLIALPALILSLACAGSAAKQAARTSPGPDAQGAVSAGEPRTGQPEAPAPPDQDSGRAADDPVEAIIARAQEEYDQGVEALRSGDADDAREHFDAAVEIFMNSGGPAAEDPRFRKAFDKIVEDIAALESELEEQPPAPDAEPSPAEELKDITTYLTPEEAQKELEKVAPEASQVSFDIPMVINEKVLSWVDIIQRRREFRDSFIGGYQRYGWYADMIHRILKEEGLPSDLIFMAFLESTYKTSAYSRARAKGIWQFMTPTGRMYGLKVNRYVDERSHPEKSTRAAARYMKDLYASLGDWHLAIAAYNTGAGNILRAQRRSGKRSYWDLAKTRYMRTETKNFVPAILALALIAKAPAKYGFEGLEHNPPLEFDRVTVAGPTDLSLVARLADATFDEVKFLNPHLRLGVTPPGERDYEVLVPKGKGRAFVAAYEAMPEPERTARLEKVHTVRRGETLAMIAARYGTSVQELRAANRIRNPRRISVGTHLRVPNVPGGAAGGESARPRRVSAAGSARGSRLGPYHVVRRGDTLFRISRSYAIPLRSLMDWNGLTESSVLLPGTRLIVRQEPSSLGTRHSSAPAAALVSIPGGGEAPPDPAGAKVVYRVRRGDNLFRIARRYGTTVESLKSWNGISGDSIRAGALLVIYPN